MEFADNRPRSVGLMTPTTPPPPVGAVAGNQAPAGNRLRRGLIPGEGAAVRVFAQIVLVAVGSALGGLTRWGVSLGVPRLLELWKVPVRVAAYPWATFLINVTGSLFLGWFSTLLTDRLVPQNGWLRPDDLKLLLAVGFTGAYTTFSTFEYESGTMLSEGDGFLAMTYLFASVFFGLLAVRLGVFLARGK